MPRFAITVGLASAVLVLTPGLAGAQLPIMVGAGHRTDRTPLDREANNIPEPVSAEAEGERSPSLLTHPKPKPRVLLGPVRPAPTPAAIEALADLHVDVRPKAGYSTDPVPKSGPHAAPARPGLSTD
jgi:hypothetical protein